MWRTDPEITLTTSRVAGLEISNLRKSFGARAVLRDVSLRIRPGEIVGFIGANGAGKTTLMRAVLGIIDCEQGAITWRAEAVSHATRRRFGYMPEERGLYPRMRIGVQLRYHAQLHGLSTEAAEAAATTWARRLGLGDRVSDRVESLSLGNQQRVQLAVALVHQPELLVLDEPFSGLDPLGVAALSDVLRQQAARGVAVLFSTHQLDLVESLCDSVTVIHRGQVQLSGPVEDLRSRVGRVLTVQLGGRRPSDDWQPTLPGLRRESQATRSGRRELALRLSEEVDAVDALTHVRSVADVEDFSLTRPSLHQVLVQAVDGAHD